MRLTACVLALLLLFGAPLATMAKPVPGGGGGRPAGGRPGGGAPHPSAASRPAAGGGGGGGFNLNRDVSASQRPARPSGGQGSRPNAGGGNRPSTGNGNRPNGGNGNGNRPNGGNGNGNRPNGGNGNGNNVNGNRPNGGNGNGNNVNVNRPTNVTNVNNVNVNRTVIANPVYGGPAWGWNRGVVWAPAPAYWGGGFWGAMAIGVTSAAVFGAIVNSSTHQTYTSYQAQPSSPGATLLSNYKLTQTQCGPPNLVVIYGPNNSVICAYPNNIVSAGNYDVDSSNLSIVSQ
jgi:hypothetical protein